MDPHSHTSGTGSTAALGGHPLHPMLVGFPITLFIGAFITDVVYLATSGAFWAQSSVWLLAVGVAMGLLAAVPGAIDLLTIEHARRWRLAWIHGLMNLGLVTLAAINLFLRWRDPEAAVAPFGVLLSAICVGLLAITGWLGGEMVYRHGVGVSKAVGHTKGSDAAHDAATTTGSAAQGDEHAAPARRP
ncbi:DUF2231 domain-containing protein [Phenylobacterium sp. J426]|uniref:DUF2231 domain-containing protein n=1 Tax=Phenylobacterium sp. J426 TaxID=2898439 RepID=UPI002150F9DB|nr:DUF2231 domain-containing protein [Phenylobacterium sp. J426]MCR5876815.1 DUF2231 domain-containing protein [Phenylobacterium sp. J426]